MGAKRFEEILAWQEARKLTKLVYLMAKVGKLARDFGLKDQLQRAAVSVMANVAEGFGSDSNREFSRFLGYARRSVFEVQSLLYAAADAEIIDRQHFREVFDQANLTLKLISGLKTSIDKKLRP